MTSFEQEHIEVEPFDREYGLDELLPVGTLEKLDRGSGILWPEKFCLARADGVVYFQSGGWTPEQLKALTDLLSAAQPQNVCCLQGVPGWDALIFPLLYELEIKGYLSIPVTDNGRERQSAAGAAMVQVLHLLISLKHQTMLTSGLHGMVVLGSYAQLKEKAAQLARSEEKYRQLAANLEIEVQKKTEEIRITHAHLMQQEKLAAIGQLSAGVAHEINNPLGFMISNLHSMRDYARDLGELVKSYRNLGGLQGRQAKNTQGTSWQQQLSEIKDLEKELDADFMLTDLPVLADETISGAERIQKIVTDLKTVARPGENALELIDIHRSIDAVLTILHTRLEKGITIDKAYGSIPLVSGVAQELNQVWLNLLTNAVDAMEGRGTLSIATHVDGDLVTIAISDTGRGIPKENLSKIFDPFFTTKQVGRGMGLGLHLVYQLVRKHNGRIDVNSVQGRGSTFSVAFSVAGSS